MLLMAAGAILGLSGCGHKPKKISNNYPVEVQVQKRKLVFTYPNGVETTRLHVPQGHTVALTLAAAFGQKAPPPVAELHAVGLTLKPLGRRTLSVEMALPAAPSPRLIFKPATGPAISARVRVDNMLNFPVWLHEKNELYMNPKTHQPLPLHEVGEGLIENMGCLMCHTTNGMAGIAPTWKNLAGTPVKLANGKTAIANYQYLRHAILHAGHPVVKNFAGVMPNFHNQLGGPKHAGRKLNAIIWYINMQSDKRGPATEPPIPDGGPVLTKK